jgi:hypothetical protein
MLCGPRQIEIDDVDVLYQNCVLEFPSPRHAASIPILLLIFSDASDLARERTSIDRGFFLQEEGKKYVYAMVGLPARGKSCTAL